MDPLRIYVGWDSREDIAYQACKQSLLDTASVPIEVIPLKQRLLKRDGLYWRKSDKLASTEFTFTRFLIAEMAKFRGWALFIDCDFIAVEDVKKLFDQANNKYALMCAQHDYTPKEGTKMDGKQQLNYPRKNWSSMMLVNCGHPSNAKLTKDLVNDPNIDGKYLHRFSWLNDSEIGEISHEWNWLVGWYKEPEDGKPKFIHYTEGGPWFEQYKDCEYNLEYYRAERKYLMEGIKGAEQKANLAKSKGSKFEELTLPKDIIDAVKTVIYTPIDPTGKYYGKTQEEAMKVIQNKFMKGTIHKNAAIDPEEGIAYHKDGLQYDEYLQSFVIGSGGRLSDWKTEQHTNTPLIIRGLGGGSRKALKHCWENKREFYAIDTGYFGNEGSKAKIWHRVTKNELQNTQPIKDRPDDRLLNWKYKKFKNDGRKILLVPPSEKVMMLWDQPSPEVWVKQVSEQLKEYTDRPIEIRLKPDRRHRITNQSLEAAMALDVYCVITYNSIAALEALNFGKPAIALGPNCATAVCNTKLSEVEKLNMPDKDTMYSLMCHLSYAQFNREEMMSGYAWSVVNEGS
jgi:lipopolysaccharide biosynthesis glycosyltransferase